jgi:hypothetical protein
MQAVCRGATVGERNPLRPEPQDLFLAMAAETPELRSTIEAEMIGMPGLSQASCLDIMTDRQR